MHRLSRGVNSTCNFFIANIVGVMSSELKLKVCCNSSLVQRDQKQHRGITGARSVLGEVQTLRDCVALTNS